MKKKYIFVVIGIILLTLLVWGIKGQMYVCGDEVCHQKKEFETGICPEDCGINTLLIPDIEDSKQPPECRVKSVVKLSGGDLKQLTFSVYNHDENAEYSPNGKKIAWSSSPGLPGIGGVDIYLMDANGENKGQLTHFGDPSEKDYLGDDYACRELGWSPNGTQIAVSFGNNYRPYERDQSYYFDNLYLLTFEGACGKL